MQNYARSTKRSIENVEDKFQSLHSFVPADELNELESKMETLRSALSRNRDDLSELKNNIAARLSEIELINNPSGMHQQLTNLSRLNNQLTDKMNSLSKIAEKIVTKINSFDEDISELKRTSSSLQKDFNDVAKEQEIKQKINMKFNKLTSDFMTKMKDDNRKSVHLLGKRFTIDPFRRAK